MKKGFTLIELLAVIVILAIIALIATPIILGIINDAKEDSNKRSVENYAHAVELAVARAATKKGGVIESGIYEIVKDSNGKQIKSQKSGNIIEIDYKGEAIQAGELEVFSDGKIELRGLSFNGKSTYNYSESNGVTAGENITETKEITHVILPDGTLLYYKGSGDIKVPATLDGIAVKSIPDNVFYSNNVFLLIYINPEDCELDSDKCVITGNAYCIDSNIDKEALKNTLERDIGFVFDIIYPKSSKEIIVDYNNLIAQGFEIEFMNLKFQNNEFIWDDIDYKENITSIDLSEVNNLIIERDLFADMTNLKVVKLPKMEELDSSEFFENNFSLEKIIVSYKEGEIPSTWPDDWNYDGSLYKYHTIEYAG